MADLFPAFYPYRKAILCPDLSQRSVGVTVPLKVRRDVLGIGLGATLQRSWLLRRRRRGAPAGDARRMQMKKADIRWDVRFFGGAGRI